MISVILVEGIEGGSLRADLDTRVVAESLLGMLRGINRYCREYSTPESATEAVGIAILMAARIDRAGDHPALTLRTAGAMERYIDGLVRARVPFRFVMASLKVIKGHQTALKNTACVSSVDARYVGPECMQR